MVKTVKSTQPNDSETQIMSYFYWNGNFQEFILPSGDLTSSGVSETQAIDAHNIFVISIILLIALSITQISTVIFSKKLTKKNFLDIFIIPTFLFNSLLLFSVFSFIHWMHTRSSSKLTFSMKTPLVYILFVGILLTMVILGFATTLSIIGKRKERMKKSTQLNKIE